MLIAWQKHYKRPHLRKHKYMISIIWTCLSIGGLIALILAVGAYLAPILWGRDHSVLSRLVVAIGFVVMWIQGFLLVAAQRASSLIDDTSANENVAYAIGMLNLDTYETTLEDAVSHFFWMRILWLLIILVVLCIVATMTAKDTSAKIRRSSVKKKGYARRQSFDDF